MIRSNKGNKYLILLVVGLAFLLLGGSLLIVFGYLPYFYATGNSYKVFTYEIAYYANGNTTFPNAPYINFSYCLLQFISYSPLLVLLTIFCLDDFKDDLLVFIKNYKKYFGVIALSYVCMVGLNLVTNVIYKVIGVTGESNNEQVISLLLSGSGNLYMIVSVVFLAPICEEFVFRKFIFGVFEEKFSFKGRSVVAIIVSCLVFSFIHVTDLESIKFIFQYIVLALPICLCYYFCDRNIYATIILHLINNAISTIASFLLR